MKQINIPYRDYIGDYGSVVVRMHNKNKWGEDNQIKILLSGLQDDVAERYDIYKSIFNSEDIVGALGGGYDDDCKKALQSMYIGDSARVGEIKQHIRDIQEEDWKDLCPYCGINCFSGYDHYLPKGEFPEYSILAINLIHCCSTCNTKKLEYWKDDLDRGIVNPYLDDLSDVEYLLCGVNCNNGIPVVEFSLESTGNDVFDSLLIKHFARFDLLARYKDRSNSEISTIRDDIESYSGTLDLESLRTVLQDRYQREVLRFGRSFWKCALRKALYLSDDYLRMLVRTEA
ncbi:hypothetical protein [Thalassolituus oleivorans]|uniref:hypothetical protein n=1 Tax=Thalassolituus oleivorans TaxID=187493 RepID=UPI0023F019F6|nr:hypothetical protein [Thalassolituus oleivorans]